MGSCHEIEVSYLRLGAPQSIVFIHGLGCTKEVFIEAFGVPHFESYGLLVYDLPGFGNSSKPTDFKYGLEDQAEICGQLIETLGLKRIHLVGHSMGGAIALLLVDQIPPRILSLVNLEGNLIAEDCFLSREIIQYSLHNFCAAGLGEMITTLRRMSESRGIIRTGNRMFCEWFSRSDPSAIYRSSESLVRWSDSGRLIQKFRDLGIKRTYVFGEDNGAMEVLGVLGKVPKIEIPNSGHLMMLDNPAAFYETLARILD